MRWSSHTVRLLLSVLYAATYLHGREVTGDKT
jgi:hypothetical protein